jgi:dGTP triphosphohydrolase
MTNPKQLHDSTIIAAFSIFENINYDMNIMSKMELGEKRNAIGSPSLQMDNSFQMALLRAICDHIAGMTDSFVLSEYSRLYGEAPLA